MLLTVYGSLFLLGEASHPITLTHVSEAVSNWWSILINAGGNLLARHCSIGYGGINGQSMLMFNGTATVQNCRIHHSGGDGIRVAGSRPLLHYTLIEDNQFGLRNLTPATPITATLNWWGHPSGPVHASNPAGQGQPVSDGVLFDPWLVTSGQGWAPGDQLLVSVGGPLRASPGQTIEMAVFYMNTSLPAEVQIIVDPSASDTTPPQVVWTLPVAQAVEISFSPTALVTGTQGGLFAPGVLIQFSEPMDPITLSPANLDWQDSQSHSLNFQSTYYGGTWQLALSLLEPLQGGRRYNLSLSANIRDVSGNPLPVTTWSFTTRQIAGGIFLPLVRHSSNR